MHVLAVTEFLKLDHFPPHEELLRNGLLTEWTPRLHGKCIMVSHQWLGYDEPDPAREHFCCLKGILGRLMKGDIRKVESYFIQRLLFSNVVVKSSEWKSMLPSMYIWIDYCSMAQVGPSADLEDLRAAASAVASIPSYVERCSLLFVLAPICQHRDTGEVCNFATWRTRGWCRLELLFAVLAPHDIRVVVCTGERSVPHMMYPADMHMLRPELGEFTCCDLGHNINGKKIPCDKARMKPVMQDLVAAKVLNLTSAKLEFERFYYKCLCDRVLQGEWQRQACKVTCPRSNFGVQGMRALGEQVNQAQRQVWGSRESLRSFLDWRYADDADVDGAGVSLLFCAAHKGDTQAVIEIATLHPHLVNRRVRRKIPDIWITIEGITPLMVAMALAEFDTVDALLKAGADPNVEAEFGLDALMAACIHGNTGNAAAWLSRFPEWNVNRPSKIFKFNALCLALLHVPDSSPIVKLLLAARAETKTKRPGFLLPILALKEDSDTAALTLLLERGVDVNERLKGQICAVRFFYRSLRICACLGIGGRPVQDWAMLDHATALHIAARRADVSMIRVLLKSKALPLRNAQGRTPLDVARAAFGGKVPSALEAALLGEPDQNPQTSNTPEPGGTCMLVPAGMIQTCSPEVCRADHISL